MDFSPPGGPANVHEHGLFSNNNSFTSGDGRDTFRGGGGIRLKVYFLPNYSVLGIFSDTFSWIS